MANLPLAFLELLAGGILLDHGVAKAKAAFAGADTASPSTPDVASGLASGAPGLWGYVFPVPPGQLFAEERTDRGQDFSTKPGGVVWSITDGIVTNGRTPLGDGPVIKVIGGPLNGRFIGYMHAVKGLVHPGQHVHAGQPVALAGGVGGGGPGHIEIYLALNAAGQLAAGTAGTHHAWTGDVIHRIMHMLNPHLVRLRPIISG